MDAPTDYYEKLLIHHVDKVRQTGTPRQIDDAGIERDGNHRECVRQSAI
ncbi:MULTISPECIES: hypothetical protein [Gordonia]